MAALYLDSSAFPQIFGILALRFPPLDQKFVAHLGLLQCNGLWKELVGNFQSFTKAETLTQHSLDSVLQCNSTWIARPAGTPKLEQNLAIMEPSELNIATIFLDWWSNSCFQELLDHADDLAIVLIVCQWVNLIAFLSTLFSCLECYCVHEWLSRRYRLGYQGEYFRLNVCPWCCAVFGNCYEIGSKEDWRYTIDIEEICGQGWWIRRLKGWSRRGIFEERGGEAFGQDPRVRLEFKGLHQISFAFCVYVIIACLHRHLGYLRFG